MDNLYVEEIALKAEMIISKMLTRGTTTEMWLRKAVNALRSLMADRENLWTIFTELKEIVK